MELLKKLYLIDAKSGSEKAQRDFILDYIKDIKDISYIVDKAGNLLVTKGKSETYPCIAAHMDEVHLKRDKDFVVIESEGFVMGMNVKRRERHGIGADDKNGIWVALRCLEKYDAIKCAFFVGEEVGCKGSAAVDMKFFDDCRFVVECDRRNNGDFINSIGGELCSKDFIKDAKVKDFGYKLSDGLTTDVGELKRRGLKVSCCNMSCGYYEPHTQSEYTYFPDLEKCLTLVEHIVGNCTKVYSHERPKPKYGNMSRGYFNAFDDGGWPSPGSWKERRRKEIEKVINLDDYDHLTDAWIDARSSITGLSFEDFTDVWCEHLMKLAEEKFGSLQKEEAKSVI